MRLVATLKPLFTLPPRVHDFIRFFDDFLHLLGAAKKAFPPRFGFDYRYGVATEITFYARFTKRFDTNITSKNQATFATPSAMFIKSVIILRPMSLNLFFINKLVISTVVLELAKTGI